MRKKIGFNLLVRKEGSLRIAREYMDFMPSSGELTAEMIGNSPRTTNGIGKQDIR